MIFSEFLLKDKLYKFIPEFVENVFNIDKIRVVEQLQPILKILIDDIICFIEYPYVDKFYRDSYYNFFSKKHNIYNRNSIRISFFSNYLDIDNYFLLSNNEINKAFYGYISLRPTTYKIIGHSFLSPKILKNHNFVCCLSKKEVLINGKKLVVDGFPFCSQDNESITCSEATIINLFDYFGNKYPEYSTILPSQVAKILSKQSYQRQLPAHGLPTENISYVLKKLGFGTVVYSSDVFKPNEFKELLYTYVESGIPIIATLSTANSNHAVLVIGRENIDKEISYNKKQLFNKNKQYEFSSIFRKLLVMNDNHPPYELVDYHKPIFDSDSQEFYHFRSFIVPLYSKVHLDAYQFKNFFHIIIKSLEEDIAVLKEKKERIKFKKNGNNVFRYYLASSKSYKNYLSNSKTISSEFKSIVINIPMPKFIWVGEIIEGSKLISKQELKSIIVVDATESGLTGHLIFATDSRFLIFKNNDFSCPKDNIDNSSKIYQIIDFGKENFYTFANNLKGEHTKWKS